LRSRSAPPSLSSSQTASPLSLISARSLCCCISPHPVPSASKEGITTHLFDLVEFRGQLARPRRSEARATSAADSGRVEVEPRTRLAGRRRTRCPTARQCPSRRLRPARRVRGSTSTRPESAALVVDEVKEVRGDAFLARGRNWMWGNAAAQRAR
jgi:hypothetical protein